jgi:hypothetical protein
MARGRSRNKRVPTDREILETIYSRYSTKYSEVSARQDTESSDNRIYLPVDLAAVAAELKVDGNLVFGRLYYYLDRKYAYQTQADGSGREGAWVHLFWLRFEAPQGRHWVNFPLLTSVLAGLQEDDRRVKWTRNLAIASFAVSLAAFTVSAFMAFGSASTKPVKAAPAPVAPPAQSK